MTNFGIFKRSFKDGSQIYNSYFFNPLHSDSQRAMGQVEDI